MPSLTDILSSTYRGYTGSRGEPGLDGNLGTLGYTGSRGDTGDQGAQGAIGYTGSQGMSIPRVSSSASVVSPLAWNSNNFDMYVITAQAEAITISADAGAPATGQKILFRIKDDGTARAITWTTAVSKGFRATGITLPTTTTIGKNLYVGCVYNATDERWDAIAYVEEA